MEQFIACFNAVVPFFVVMGVGWFVVRTDMVNARFIDGLNNLVFRLFVPAMLFQNLYSADLGSAMDWGLAGYFVVVTVILYGIFWLAGSRFLPRERLGAFVQAGYRGNYVIFATPILASLMGTEAMTKASLMSPFVVATYSILAAVVFTVTVGSGDRTGAQRVAGVLVGIIKTPFIIAVLVALAVNLSGIQLPVFLERSVGYMADMGSPAALLGIGGVMGFDRLRANFNLAALATLMKNVLVPIAMIVPAVLLGFRGTELAILATMGLAPTALNSFATARSMGGDGDLAASCVVLSTLCSLVTIVLGLTMLGNLGMI